MLYLSFRNCALTMLATFAGLQVQAQTQGFLPKYPGWTRHIQGEYEQVPYAVGDSIYFASRSSGGFAYNAINQGWQHRTDSAFGGNPASGTGVMAAGSPRLGLGALLLSNGGLYVTTNNWRSLRDVGQPNGVFGRLEAVYSTDSGIIGLTSSAVFRTVNGRNWEAVSGASNRGNAVSANGAKVIIANRDELAISLNYGRTYRYQPLNTAATNLQAFTIADSGLYYAIADNVLYRRRSTATAWTNLGALPAAQGQATGMVFATPARGLISVGNSNTYLFTADSGRTLQLFTNPRVGQAKALVAAGRLFLRSELSNLSEVLPNGSLAPVMDYMESQHLQDMSFGPTTGLCAATTKSFVSRNHGQTFIQAAPITAGLELSCAYVHNDSILLAGTQQGGIWRSRDYGTTWQEVLTGQFGATRYIQFDGTARGVIIAKQENFYRYSADHGLTWQFAPVGGYPLLRADGVAIIPSHGNQNGSDAVFRLNFNLAPGGLPRVGTLPRIITGFYGGTASMADTSLLYLWADGSGTNSFFRSENGGRTWTDNAPGLLNTLRGNNTIVMRTLGADTLIAYNAGSGTGRAYISASRGLVADTLSPPASAQGVTREMLYIGPGLERWAQFTRQGRGSALFFSRDRMQLTTSLSHRSTPTRAQALLMPNPATSIVRCLVQGKLATEVRIYTLSGQLISTQTRLTNGQASVSELPRGIYLLQATSAGGVMAPARLVVE